MWNHVGKPSILEGNTFLPLQGIPIAYKLRKIARLADWLPEPLTVPTRIARSFTMGAIVACPARAGAASTTERLDGMMFLATWAARAPLFSRHAEFAAQREDDFEGTANRSLAYPPIDHSNTFGN